MNLKYKNTIYEPIYEKTNNNVGLKKEDYWVDIHFKLKNDEISYHGILKGLSFNELIKWNNLNEKFINKTMKKNEKITFIRRIGEMYYFPNESKVEKRLYLFDDLDKYYTVYFDMDELKEIYNINKVFINNMLNKKRL